MCQTNETGLVVTLEEGLSAADFLACLRTGMTMYRERQQEMTSASLGTGGEEHGLESLGLVTDASRSLETVSETTVVGAELPEVVLDELARQQEQWGDEHDDGHSTDDWQRILAEEVSEVAAAGDSWAAWQEVAHVAAVSLSWLAAVDRRRCSDARLARSVGDDRGNPRSPAPKPFSAASQAPVVVGGTVTPEEIGSLELAASGQFAALKCSNLRTLLHKLGGTP